MEFVPIVEEVLFLYEKTANSISNCIQIYHSTLLCRIFNFYIQSHRCRMYQGDINTMGSIVISSSSQSIVGSISLTTELFTNRQSFCSFCQDNRYLTCINSICQCHSYTFFDGKICQSQKLLGAQCQNDIECRNDRNLTCLYNIQCDCKYNLFIQHIFY